MPKKNHSKEVKPQQRRLSIMSGFSDTALLTIAHFVQGSNDADIALRAAAAQELFERELISSPAYHGNLTEGALYKRCDAGKWRDELWEAITLDDDTVEGVFYRDVLGMEPPKFPGRKRLGKKVRA